MLLIFPIAYKPMIPLSARFAFELYNPSDDMLAKRKWLNLSGDPSEFQLTMNLVALCFARGSLPICAINRSS